MDFYLDPENSKGNYSYATFHEAFGGKPVLTFKQDTYLLVPVINQGIYDLPSFNNGSQTPVYFDYSYYLFLAVSEFTEIISIRENKGIRGEIEKTGRLNSGTAKSDEFKVELEMGWNGEYIYAATWRVKAKQFGVLIPSYSKQSENDKIFFKNEKSLDTTDMNFLLGVDQIYLEQYLSNLR